MNIEVLKSKIHRATITQAELHYVGSITIDAELMRAADLHPYEKVLITDVQNGSRFETYVLEGEAGSGTVCLNGPSARLVAVGDQVLVLSFCSIPVEQAEGWKPVVVFPDAANRVAEIASGLVAGASA